MCPLVKMIESPVRIEPSPPQKPLLFQKAFLVT
jgi:hypothetical protein